jgi:hypothetical protein
MAGAGWMMRGEYMESCNCDYLCPCIYTNPQGPATHDNCTAIMAFRIDEGNAGATPLAGLKFALVIRSGRVMADGNWIFAGIIDDAADPAQRQALAPIVAGDAGGPPGMIRQNLVADFRGVEFRPIDFTRSGNRRALAIGAAAAFEIEGVASRRRSGDLLYLDNTSHPANPRLALARADNMRLHAFGLDLDLSGAGNNGHFAPFRWSS